MIHLHKWWQIPDDDIWLTTLRGITFCQKCGRIKGRNDAIIKITHSPPDTPESQRWVSFDLVRTGA